MRLRPDVEVYKNSKTKVYSDGTTNTTVCRSAIFKDSFDVTPERLENIDEKHRIAMEHSQNIIDFLHEHGIEYNDYYQEKKRKERENPKPVKHHNNDDVRNDSLKRAKDSIFDYILNNDFDYFFTGTIDPEYCDSKDPKEVLQPVQRWLKNMVDRYDLHYIMIAERHKKGGIHFHGLMKGNTNLRLVDSGTKLYKGRKKPVCNEKAEKLGLYGGRTVYNLKTWQFGFTTAIALTGDRLNTAFYVTKYITKDCKKIFGKFFWHSRNLKKPTIIIDNMEFDDVPSIESNGFKYLFKRGEDNDTKGNELDLQLYLSEQTEP